MMTARWIRKMQLLAAMLVAFAFLALPAAALEDCAPHSGHHCEIAHADLHGGELPAGHDQTAHEHAHGACHVPMIQPSTVAWSEAGTGASTFAFGKNDSGPNGSPTLLERPPRA